MSAHISTIGSRNAMSVQGANRVLACLSEEEQQRLSPSLRRVSLRRKQVLLRQGEAIQYVVFPNGGVCSLIKVMEDGTSIEVLGVGGEGVVGAGVALGQSESGGDVVVHVATDAAELLPAEVFKGEVQKGGALCDWVTRYNAALTLQLTQTAACNALHSAEERCCRWLLMTHDRVQRDEFPMTHETLAMALGVRRPTVTLIMAGLYGRGAVSHTRGRIRITDRAAIETASCACYRVMSAAFPAAVPESATHYS